MPCSKRLLSLLLAVPAPLLLAQSNVTTWHNDNARTGENPSEGILTPSNVNSDGFGKLFQVVMDGKVDAEPLYVSALNIPGKGTHNTVFAATEHDSVYAFDADTGAILWQTSLLRSGETPSDDRGCNQVTPEIGITATPVIDVAHGWIYIVSMSKDASGHYYQRVHSLWLTSGAEQYGSPVTVQASVPGTGDNSSNGRVVFNPASYKDRPGLLLLGTTLYTSWSSHCDIRPYTGWVIGYSTLTGAQTGVFNFVPNGSDGAPWNAGAAPAADASGNIFIAAGNGTFDETLTSQGFPTNGDYGNSVVKLSTAGGNLQATDYWTMFNSNAESDVDQDLGSGGLMLLPTSKDGSGAQKQLAVVAGKDSNLYVLDQAYLGKYDARANGTLNQELDGALGGGMWSSPAYFDGHVYYGPVRGALRSFDVNSALLSSSPSSSTPETFPYPGTTPSVSSNNGQNGIVWAVENSSPAVLHAYDANNLATELYTSAQASGSRDAFGNGNKFMTPMINMGKVYVGTPNGVAAFGLLRNGATLADGDYQITNAASGLFLTDYTSSPSAATQIVQNTWVPGGYQQWFLSWQNNGYYVIENVASGLMLTAPGAGAAGAPLSHEQMQNSDAQLWALQSTSGGYMLRNKATNLVLGNPNANPSPAALALQPASADASVAWSITAAK